MTPSQRQFNERLVNGVYRPPLLQRNPCAERSRGLLGDEDPHSTPDLGTLDTTDMTEVASSDVITMREFELVTHTCSRVSLKAKASLTLGTDH